MHKDDKNDFTGGKCVKNLRIFQGYRDTKKAYRYGNSNSWKLFEVEFEM